MGYPSMTLAASGSEVGLNWGEMGNSEVGHLNIGAGRVYYQTMPRINKAVSDGSFFENSAFLDAMRYVKAHNSRLHLVGLLSPGGVHSHEDHLIALLEIAAKEKVANVFVHAITDGRDTLYNSSGDFMKKALAAMKRLGVGRIASVAAAIMRWIATTAGIALKKLIAPLPKGSGRALPIRSRRSRRVTRIRFLTKR